MTSDGRFAEVSRRGVLTGGAATFGAALLPRASAVAASSLPASFIRVEGAGFRIGGKPYRFVGANIWYGAYLGADAAFGDRARLARELDALAALGVTNLRVLASSELSALRNSLDPAFTIAPGRHDARLLRGLDHLLAQLRTRGMRAVLYLTNNWEWSGGHVAWRSYAEGGRLMNADDPAHPWPDFADYAAGFYGMPAAVALQRDWIRALITRVNDETGIAYRDDPTIMAWQLCNEPRAGVTPVVVDRTMPAYLAWLRDTAALIRSLAPRQLVSAGHEGLHGLNYDTARYVAAHEHVDYFTAHMWPQNWGLLDSNDLERRFDYAMQVVRAYIDAHVRIAEAAGKPLVFEEFGFPRDGFAYDVGTPTAARDRFYGAVYAAVERAVADGGAVAGSNFWAWGGAGRAAHRDHRMRRGETAYLGDPPHEPQGWYSVFDGDASTRRLIEAHAARLPRGAT